MYNLTWCNEKECDIDSVILLSKCVTWIESRGNIRNINWNIPKEKKMNKKRMKVEIESKEGKKWNKKRNENKEKKKRE